jgi:hypothetical protein
VVGCLLGDQQLLDPLQLHTGISVSTEGRVLRNALAGADRPVAMSSVCLHGVPFDLHLGALFGLVDLRVAKLT